MTIHTAATPSPTERARNLYTVQPLFDGARSFKLGSIVPIRLQLVDAQGANVSSAAIVPTATGLVRKGKMPAPDMQESGNCRPDGDLHYDSALQGYVFNLSTRSLAVGTWELYFGVAGDPSTYHISFSLNDRAL